MPRIIALYLPQFHPIPENDRWWGEGFTEWTNVRKAKPLFATHVQPKVPTTLGYYDLRDAQVRQQQAELAREAGIEGFCYYHYWFGGGKQLLERPFNEVVASGQPDFPFCLCWANHSWSNKTWQRNSALQREAMCIEQTYPGTEDETAHFLSLLPAFRDKRYMTIDGRLIFVIYNPLTFPRVGEFMAHWQQLAQEHGLPGFYFIGMTPNTHAFVVDENGRRKASVPNLKSSAKIYNDVLAMGFDAVNSYGKRRGEMLAEGKIRSIVRHGLRKLGLPFVHQTYDYARTVRHFFAPEDVWENVFPTVIPNWDRTPRAASSDGIYTHATPQAFEQHLRQAVALAEKKDPQHQVIFLKSWNEWGEGNYVEPDAEYGHERLAAIRRVVRGQ